jgi:predicted O-linked N-acetylglucosamine transferase (SPINDLY family)
MAGALLTAAGLPELITTDLQAYEDAAVSLATTPAQRKALHQKLAKARDERPLFDSLRFTRALEEEYRKLVDELPVAPDTAVEAFQEIAQPTRQAEMVGGRVERPAAHAWDLIAIVEQAETRQKNGNLSGAIEVYRQSLKRRHTKDDWMLQFNLGVLLQQAGKSRDARDAFEKTLRQRPDFRLARVALSTMR